MSCYVFTCQPKRTNDVELHEIELVSGKIPHSVCIIQVFYEAQRVRVGQTVELAFVGRGDLWLPLTSPLSCNVSCKTIRYVLSPTPFQYINLLPFQSFLLTHHI